MLTSSVQIVCLRRAQSLQHVTMPGCTHLGLGVVRAKEVGLVRLQETLAGALWEVLVVVEDAARGVCGQVDAIGVGDVCQHESADHVGADHLDLHTGYQRDELGELDEPWLRALCGCLLGAEMKACVAIDTVCKYFVEKLYMP